MQMDLKEKNGPTKREGAVKRETTDTFKERRKWCSEGWFLCSDLKPRRIFLACSGVPTWRINPEDTCAPFSPWTRLLHQLCDEGTEEKMELTKLKGGREWLISCA